MKMTSVLLQTWAVSVLLSLGAVANAAPLSYANTKLLVEDVISNGKTFRQTAKIRKYVVDNVDPGQFHQSIEFKKYHRPGGEILTKEGILIVPQDNVAVSLFARGEENGTVIYGLGLSFDNARSYQLPLPEQLAAMKRGIPVRGVTPQDLKVSLAQVLSERGILKIVDRAGADEFSVVAKLQRGRDSLKWLESIEIRVPAPRNVEEARDLQVKIDEFLEVVDQAMKDPQVINGLRSSAY